VSSGNAPRLQRPILQRFCRTKAISEQSTSVCPDRSRLISHDEISPAERGATVRGATQVGPAWRWSRLWARILGQAGTWPGLAAAAVERAVAGGQI
jgi:hypothetical protein